MPILGMLRGARCAVVVLLCLGVHTGRSLADDGVAVAESEVEAGAPQRVGRDGRRWRVPDPERPPDTQASQPASRDYGGWLIASYLSIPVLAIGLPVFIGETWGYDTGSTIAFFAGLAVGCSLPATVHWLHGESKRGVRNIAAVPLIVIGGFAMGALVGAWLTSDEERENDDFASLSNAVAGAGIGAGVVLATWATYDVVDTANARKERKRSASSETRFALAPVPGGIAARIAGTF